MVLIYNIYIISKLLKQGNRDTVISDNISKCIYDNVNNIVLPILVVKKNGEILWENNRFSYLEKSSVIGKNIGAIIKGIDLE